MIIVTGPFDDGRLGCSAPQADVFLQTVFGAGGRFLYNPLFPIMTERVGFVLPVTVAAVGANIEVATFFGTGGRDYRFHVVVSAIHVFPRGTDL